MRTSNIFWQRLVQQALKKVETPFYIFSPVPVQEGVNALEKAFTIQGGRTKEKIVPGTVPHGIPVRHWLSCKTQPIRPLLDWWRRQGRGIEVVSEFEFLAALDTGFSPEHILLNGPAKHRWLPRNAVAGLTVNFDSLNELNALLPLVKKYDWRVGIRLLTDEEFDPEFRDQPTQFGLSALEAAEAIWILKRAKARLEVVHFHLRTNIASADIYEHAIREVAGLCAHNQFTPSILDCGGGFPPANTQSRDGKAYDAEFNLEAMRGFYALATQLLPGLKEIWLENGRYLSAPSGVLVIKVLDVKERRGLRQLICDGGRTMNALVSNWERHKLFAVPKRNGKQVLTAVYGPTCMAFDRLDCLVLPDNIRPGDHLVWMEAGAYHIPWETRFSHGAAAVVWHDGKRLEIARPAQTFADWWGEWE